MEKDIDQYVEVLNKTINSEKPRQCKLNSIYFLAIKPKIPILNLTPVKVNQLGHNRHKSSIID